MALSSTANAKEVLDILHRQYVKRESGALHFDCNGETVVFVFRYGDVVEVQGGPLESEGGSFQDYLCGRVENVFFTEEVPGQSGVPVDKGMEMLLFELAVGMDRQLAATLEDVRKTGKLPREAVRTAVVNFRSEKEKKKQQHVFILKEGPNTIGRSEDNDISISDPGMSRHHARIQLFNGEAMVEDLGSANGVRLNRKLVQQAQLAEGNLLFIGNSVFRFFWSECGSGILFNMNQDDSAFEDQNTTLIPRS